MEVGRDLGLDFFCFVKETKKTYRQDKPVFEMQVLDIGI
jgi:hypothetical protein